MVLLEIRSRLHRCCSITFFPVTQPLSPKRQVTLVLVVFAATHDKDIFVADFHFCCCFCCRRGCSEEQRRRKQPGEFTRTLRKVSSWPRLWSTTTSRPRALKLLSRWCNGNSNSDSDSNSNSEGQCLWCCHRGTATVRVHPVRLTSVAPGGCRLLDQAVWLES